jgi:hypothetical protein
MTVPAEDLGSVGHGPMFQPEYDARNTIPYSHSYMLSSEMEAKRRKIESLHPAQHYLPPRLPNSGFTSEHHFNPACPCHSCVERLTITQQRTGNASYLAVPLDTIPSPFLSPVNPTSILHFFFFFFLHRFILAPPPDANVISPGSSNPISNAYHTFP